MIEEFGMTEKRTGLTEKGKKRRRHEILVSYAYLIPWFIFFAIFTVYPFIYGAGMSFFKQTLSSSQFIGLENYKELFADEQFKESIIVTLKFVAIIIPGTIIFSLFIAYAIQGAKKWFQSLVKIVFYTSSIVSQVALVIVWRWMFSPSYGLFASICNLIGVAPVDLLGNTKYSIPLLSFLVMSFTVAQPIILFSSAIDGVSSTYSEAAALDGATDFQIFRKITLPLIRPTILFVLVTTTINNLQVFLVPYLLTGGGPNNHTTPILLLIYRNAFDYGNFGYASAMGVVLFVIIAVFVSIQFKMQTKGDE